MSDSLTAVSLGAGILLVRDTDLHVRFAPYGMSLKAFRKWRRALGCPAMVMPNGDELIDLHAFRLAIKLAMRFGSKDFKVGTSKARFEEYEAHWRVVVADLLAARKEDYALNTEEVRTALETAADRVALFLSQFTGKAVKEAAKTAKALADTIGVDTPETVDAT